MKEKPIDFLLLPNNSKLSGFIISKLQLTYPKLQYLGTHGWGDANYGFLFHYGVSPETQGFCLRAGRDFSEMADGHGVQSLDYEWKGKLILPNYTGFSVIHFIRQVAKDLCSLRPESKADYLAHLATTDRSHFKLDEPLSVYRLNQSKLSYWYVLPKQK